MAYAHWLTEKRDSVFYLTLNRTATGNNVNLDCLAELRAISHEIAADDSVRVVVLRAAGKHFSIGMDVAVIGEMAGLDYATYAQNLGDGQRAIDAFEAIDKPMIAEIHGFCIGAGIILAACCDFRISSDRAVYSLPEVKRSIGVIMGLHRVTRLIGTGMTKRMAMLGENFSARQMQQAGFITELVAEAELQSATEKFIRKLLALPPKAVALNKRIADFSYAEFLAASQRFELEQQFSLNQSADFREAMSAFAEKREPRYTGK